MNKQFLIIKNKVNKEDIFYVDKLGVIVEPGTPDCTPSFVFSPNMWQLQLAGVQDIYQPTILDGRAKEIALPFITNNVESSYARTLLSKDTTILDGRQGIIIDLGGQAAEVVYGFQKSAIDNGFADISKAVIFNPGYAGPGLKRQGVHGMLSEGTDYREYVSEKLGMELSSFAKVSETSVKFPAKKIGTRVNVSASGGTIVPLFEGYSYSHTEVKTYTFLGSEIESTVYVLKSEEGICRIEWIPEDFSVVLENVELYGSIFNGDNAEFGNFNVPELVKPATDGSIYVDADFAGKAGLEHAFTFRFAEVTKGMASVMPELAKRTGSHVVMFGGAVKGDPTPYIQRNQLDFATIMNARVHDSRLMKFSRQAAKRAFAPEVFQFFHARTNKLVEKVMELDINAITEFLSIGKGLDENEEVESMEQGDIQVVELFHENKTAFLMDGVLRERLRSFLLKQLEQFMNGESVIIEGAVWRHMVTDPYTIMTQLQAGKMSATVAELKGISAGNTLTVFNGKLNSNQAVLYRFPFVHRYEARKVNVSKMSMSKETLAYYKKYAKSFTGMNIYSLVDMNAEAQSGADFDGDTTIVCWNPAIVQTTKEYPVFLDYSMVEGKLVGGAPFEDVQPADYSFLTEADKVLAAKEQVEFSDNGDVTVKGNVTPEVEGLIWKTVAYLSMAGLQPGFVGLLSNASDTVVEYTTTVKDAETVAKLDRLNSFLTAAVRWEIDKTKHGGAFYEALPFLGAITEGCSKESLAEMEAKYDLVLAPFFAEDKGVMRFRISQSMYFGRKMPKRALFINSAERSYLDAHKNTLVAMKEKVASEGTDQYNLIGYAQKVVSEGIAAGVISDEVLAMFDFGFATQDAMTAKHPLRNVLLASQAMGRAMAAFKDNQIDESTKDAVIAQVRTQAFENANNMSFKMEGKYVFALSYLSIMQAQFRAGSKKAGVFRAKYISALFTFYAKFALEFLRACNDMKFDTNIDLTNPTPTSFFLKGEGEVTVGQQLVVFSGRTNVGSLVVSGANLLNGVSDGVLVVTYVKVYESGIKVEGLMYS